MFRSFFQARKRTDLIANRMGSARLRVECLESRYCLSAGNVVATFNGGNLMLKGDNNDDQISIAPATGGGVTVTGTGGTTINGAAAATFPGAVKSLQIKFGDGRDSVRIAGTAVNPTLTISGDAQIQLGKGADTVNIGDFIVGGQFQVKAGDGAADSVTIAPSASTVGLKVSMDAKIQLGDGNNDGVSIGALTGSHNLNVQLGKGASDVVVAESFPTSTVGPSSVSGDVQIQLGDGNGDAVHFFGLGAHSLKTQLGKGASDFVDINESVASGDAEIWVGDGSQDRVSLFGDAFGHDLTVHLGNGHGDSCNVGDIPRFSIPTIISGNAQIELGNGQGDSLTIASFRSSEEVKGNLLAKVGNGDNDSIDIEGLTVDKTATLQTGNGMNDTVRLANNSFAKTEKHYGKHTTER